MRIQENECHVCVCSNGKCVCVFSVFLSMVLVGTALWWWRGQFGVRRPLAERSFSLKESQDPLLVLEPPLDPNTKAREAFTHQFVPVRRRIKPFWCDAPFHCRHKGWKSFLLDSDRSLLPLLLCRIRQEPVDKH